MLILIEIVKFLNVEYLANFVTCTCPIRVKGGREGPRVTRRIVPEGSSILVDMS